MMKYIVIACIFLICAGGGVLPTARQAIADGTKPCTVSETCSGEDQKVHGPDSEVYAMYPYYTGDHYVYMDSDAQAINDTFSFAAPFRNGFAIVEKEGKVGVIDISGRFIIKPEFDEIISLSDDNICFKAINHYTKEKSSWTIFGTSKWIENHVNYKLYDASGKSFYGYSGRDEYDPPLHVLKDRIFVQGKNTEVFADDGKGRIKSLRVLKRLYSIVDHNHWLKNDNSSKLSLCAIDSNKCSAEAYTEVKYSQELVLIKDSTGRYYIIRDGLKEVGVKNEKTLTLTMLLNPAQREALQQLPDGLRMDWNRTFHDGSAVLRNNVAAFYISQNGNAYALPQHSRVTYLGPDTLILTNTIMPQDETTETGWEFCIYNPIDGVFVLDWQDSTLRALGKSRERFVKEKDGTAILIDRQGNKISAEYASITATADPLLYLADKVYIFAADGGELRIPGQ